MTDTKITDLMASSSTVGLASWMQDTLKEGISLLADGRAKEAAACCKRLLSAKPDMVEAHLLVGLVALEIKDFQNAVSAFGSVTKLQPDHGTAWAHLAKQFMLGGQPAQADSALKNAIKHHNDNPVVLDLIGAVYELLGDQREAAVWIDRAVQMEPKCVPFLVNQANNYTFFGKPQEAEEVLRKVLGYHPVNANAHWLLSNVRKARDRDHVKELEQLVQQENFLPLELAFLNYGLGKELEDLEEWDKAFDAFARGAAARRTTLDFDEQSEIDMYDAFGEVLTAEWLRKDAGGHDDASPIFIIGQPRTGTTLIERIISSHSQVHSAGELRHFGTAVRKLSNYPGPKRYSAQLADLAANVDCKELGKAYMATTKSMRGSLPRFVDKLPQNHLYLPLILKALPKAKIIHLKRNPMDACFSNFKQLFADAYPHSYDQAEIARHHARYYHLMAVWRERFGSRYFDIAYEDTARDAETNARALIEFLELPWEDACMEFHKQDAPVTTASAAQVRQPAHTKSIDRWKRYESQLAIMRNTLHEQGVPTDQY